MDLGECPKIHDLALRADYEKASASKDYFYDLDVSMIDGKLIRNRARMKTDEYFFFCSQAMEHLQAFISDCDRRTEAAKQRLAETQEELSAEVAVKANAVHELAEQIGKKLAKAEQLGEEGLVDESMKLMEEVSPSVSRTKIRPTFIDFHRRSTSCGRRNSKRNRSIGTRCPPAVINSRNCECAKSAQPTSAYTTTIDVSPTTSAGNSTWGS